MANASTQERKKRGGAFVNPFLSEPYLKGSQKDLVCYLPPGRHGGDKIVGPSDQWNSDKPDHRRDSELCNRIHKLTGATVRVCWYDVGCLSVDKDGIREPKMMIVPVYDWARVMKFDSLHFVGYSGGAMVGSSQLAFYPPRAGDPAVKTLVLIGGDVGSGIDKPHSNAAFFADRIKARTRLIYGTKDDPAKFGAQIWKEHNSKTDIPPPYVGGHGFYEDGQFENVVRMVIEWLPKVSVIKRRKASRIVRERYPKRKRSKASAG